MFGIKKMKERIQELEDEVSDLKRLLKFETEHKRPASLCWSPSQYHERSNLRFGITVGPHRVCIDATPTTTETYNLKAFDIKDNACNPPKRRKG